MKNRMRCMAMLLSAMLVMGSVRGSVLASELEVDGGTAETVIGEKSEEDILDDNTDEEDPAFGDVDGDGQSGEDSAQDGGTAAWGEEEPDAGSEEDSQSIDATDGAAAKDGSVCGDETGEWIEEEWVEAAEGDNGSEVEISICGDAALTYTGYEIMPSLCVRYGTDTLSEYEYSIVFENNIDAGTATAHVSGIGGYSFEKDFSFEIMPHTLTEEDVQVCLEKYDLRYNSHSYGQNAFSVAIGDVALVNGTDYTIEGEDAFEDGASGAEAVITGIGNCTGSVTIRVPEYEPMTVEIGGDFIYGREFEPVVSVKIGDMTLIQGKEAGDGDYYVKSTFTDERTVMVEVFGVYEGAEIYDFKSICMEPYILVDADVSLELQEYEYTGTDIKPSVTVSANGRTLTEGLDYSVSYEKNTNVGIAAVVVTGTGNYGGVVTKKFTIKKKKTTPKVMLSASSFTYNGKVRKPTVTVKDGNTVLKKAYYTITWPTSINTGTYKIRVTLKGAYSGTGTASYRITRKKTTPKVTLSSSSFIYNGKVQKPAVTVKDGSAVLKKSDYTVSFAKGMKNVGAYKVTVTLKGNYTGKKAVTFRIVPDTTSIKRFATEKGKLAFKAEWEKRTKQVTGYQIQYSTDKGFKEGTCTTVMIKNAYFTSAVLGKGLAGNKTYYIRMRTYKKAGTKFYYSAWSPTKHARSKRPDGSARIDVLMIGNSLTYYMRSGKVNKTIERLKSLGSKSGYAFNVEYVAYGGEKLATYTDSNNVRGMECINLINSRTWDIVVLQEETDRAIIAPALFKNAAKSLAEKIRARSPEAEIFLNCTWAYDKMMYEYSHAEQQKLMNANYRDVASAIGASVIYSGSAFDKYRLSGGSYYLYLSDKNHASPQGYYLNACCLYAGITGKSPKGIKYYGPVNSTQGALMQDIATQINRGLLTGA